MIKYTKSIVAKFKELITQGITTIELTKNIEIITITRSNLFTRNIL